jgi:hypothetical protein
LHFRHVFRLIPVVSEGLDGGLELNLMVTAGHCPGPGTDVLDVSDTSRSQNLFSRINKMGQSPSILESSGAIGMLEFNTCCPQCGGGHFDECQLCGVCCPAIAYPHGPEWEAAAVGFAPLLAEAERIAGAQPTCCGCYDAMAVKTALDAGWTAKANAYLARYNLRAEVYYWITTDDKGNVEHHVAIQFFRGAAPPGDSTSCAGSCPGSSPCALRAKSRTHCTLHSRWSRCPPSSTQ